MEQECLPFSIPPTELFFHVLYLGHLHNIYFKKEKIFQLDWYLGNMDLHQFSHVIQEETNGK